MFKSPIKLALEILRWIQYYNGPQCQPVTQKVLAEHMSCCSSHLEKCMVGLRKMGLIRGMRGRNGGYILDQKVYNKTTFLQLARILYPEDSYDDLVDVQLFNIPLKDLIVPK